MNPRIRELAEQSTEKIHRFSYSLGHRTETIFDREKFAELIVRECIMVVEDSEGYSQYFPHVAKNIEKHFKVKP